MTAGVRLNVLGGFGLSVDGAPAPTLPRKTRALLAVLAVQGEQPMAREAVGELLWPGRGAEQVNHSLREALYQLRRPMRDYELVVSRDRGLVLGEGVSTDVAAFRRDAAHDDLLGLRRAAAAYGGPLLDGFPPVADDFEHWLTARRAAIEDAALQVLARIGDLCTRAGDAAGAMEAAERMFAIDPLREEGHARLLQACRAAGRRADGLRYYATIVDVLRRELDVAPAPATRDLARMMREEMAPEPPAWSPVPLTQPAPTTRPPPVAVLPFQQLGGEAVASHLADGIMVDVICQLAGLRELQVISHGSTIGYRDPATDLRQIERDLGARYVVRGTMRRQGGQLRLTTELADAGTGVVVWARTHDTAASLDFADQDRLVAQIVNTLAPRVHEHELRRIRGKRPDSLSVYEKVLLAREHLVTMQREPFDRARGLLAEVIEAEPGYGEAYALMADCRAMAMTQGWSTDRDGVTAEVEGLAKRALRLDPDNQRALMFYAHRRSLMHRDFDSAMKMFDHALTQWPGSAMTWAWSSYTWAYVGEGKEAVRRARKAIELSPRDREEHHFQSALCVSHYLAGDYDEAVAAGLRAIENPACIHATYRWTAGALAATGKLVEARHMKQLAMERLPGQGVSHVMRISPIRDAKRREAYGAHLLASGFPP